MHHRRGLTRIVAALHVAAMLAGVIFVPVSARTLSIRTKTIATDGRHNLIAIQKDGTVRSNDRDIDLSGFQDVVNVAIDYDWALGLKSDGTVVFSGKNETSEAVQEALAGWTDIVDIAADSHNFYGLKADGSVVAAGSNEYGQADVSDWEDIVSLSVGLTHPGTYTAGVREDGTVVATGQRTTEAFSSFTDTVQMVDTKNYRYALKSDGTVECSGEWEAVPDWKDIVQLATSLYRVVGLKSDGTVVFHSIGGDSIENDVSGWEDVAAIAAIEECTVGIQADGGVLWTGDMDADLKWALKNVQPPVSQCVSSKDLVLEYGSTAAAGYYHNTVAAGNYHSVWLNSDGTVSAAGGIEGSSYAPKSHVDSWNRVISVHGASHTVAVLADGTVAASGLNNFGQCNLGDWKDIVAADAADNHTVGLLRDGTVVARGDDSQGQCQVSAWRGMVQVSASVVNTYGLRADGTVAAIGSNKHGQCDVSHWEDIAAISAGNYYVFGLKKDGTVVAAGDIQKPWETEYASWQNIAAISAGGTHLVGLRTDGTVVTCGENRYGQGNVSGWTDMVAISAGLYHTIGMRADGSLAATGSNGHGQLDIE